jgi:hypothetical protein
MDDVEALSTIVGVLKQLDDESQRRVLASVGAFLGIGNGGYQFTQSMPAKSDLNFVSPSTEPSFSADRTLSAKEFLRDKQPGTDVERVTCLAYYLTHYRDTPHFKTLDISSLNIEAAQPKFSSASVAVENARAKGFLVPSTKGNKQISAAGERYVELLPDREAARASLVNGKSKRAVRKARAKKTR